MKANKSPLIHDFDKDETPSYKKRREEKKEKKYLLNWEIKLRKLQKKWGIQHSMENE